MLPDTSRMTPRELPFTNMPPTFFPTGAPPDCPDTPEAAGERRVGAFAEGAAGDRSANFGTSVGRAGGVSGDAGSGSREAGGSLGGFTGSVAEAVETTGTEFGALDSTGGEDSDPGPVRATSVASALRSAPDFPAPGPAPSAPVPLPFPGPIPARPSPPEPDSDRAEDPTEMVSSSRDPGEFQRTRRSAPTSAAEQRNAFTQSVAVARGTLSIFMEKPISPPLFNRAVAN